VKVSPSTYRMRILKEVTGEPPLLESVQTILTFDPSIDVTGESGTFGFYAARTESVFDGLL